MVALLSADDLTGQDEQFLHRERLLQSGPGGDPVPGHMSGRHDVTQTLCLIDGIPPVAGRPGRPRRRPDSLLGDKGYDSNPRPRAVTPR